MLSAAARRLPSASLTTRRMLSVSAARSYGALSDEDRIFQNIYGRHDWGIKGAEKRVSPRFEKNSVEKKRERE
jgi:hypothetical protein